jgi:hypothetical protein
VVPAVVVEKRKGGDKFPNEFIAGEDGTATVLPLLLHKSAFDSLLKYARSEDAEGYPVVQDGRVILPGNEEPNTGWLMTTDKSGKVYSVKPAYNKAKQLNEAVAFVQSLTVNDLRTRDGDPTTLDAVAEDVTAWEIASAERWARKNVAGTPSF